MLNTRDITDTRILLIRINSTRYKRWEEILLNTRDINWSEEILLNTRSITDKKKFC